MLSHLDARVRNEPILGSCGFFILTAYNTAHLQPFLITCFPPDNVGHLSHVLQVRWSFLHLHALMPYKQHEAFGRLARSITLGISELRSHLNYNMRAREFQIALANYRIVCIYHIAL